MAKVTPSRKKITKADADKEFENLVREEEKNRAVSNPKTEELERLRNQEIRQAVEGISVDVVVQKISGMGLEISKSLSELSGKLVAEVEKLTTIREDRASKNKDAPGLENSGEWMNLKVSKKSGYCLLEPFCINA
jgi:colicin import membrane protein